MNIIKAIEDENLFRPFLGDDLESWRRWMTALRALYGHRITKPENRALVESCTGRSPDELPKEGFKTALFLVGRRSGKSKISAVIGAYEALFGGHEKRLSKGETGIVPIISPSRYQSTVIFSYLKGIFETPLLAQEVAEIKESAQSLVLRNGIEIRVIVADWRTTRGFAVVCALVDELCFIPYSDESKIKSDGELVRAIRPALMTTGGKLIGISSPYAARGYAFQQWRRQHGSNKGTVEYRPEWRSLVWNAPSILLNPTLCQEEIDKEIQDDPEAGRSEWMGSWREDCSEYITRAVVEALVVAGRRELVPRSRLRHEYRAGCDMSGGRRDSAALVICHKEDGKIIEDFAREWKAPFKPHSVVTEICLALKDFGLGSLTGDAYAGDWPKDAFRTFGIRYRIADFPKNDLYRDLLPILCGGPESIELLDNATQTNQLISLERRPRSGGKDIVDHPVNGRDDVANALAVSVSCLRARTRVIGSFPLADGRVENFSILV